MLGRLRKIITCDIMYNSIRVPEEVYGEVAAAAEGSLEQALLQIKSFR